MKHQVNKANGFTIVELVVIMPIVILAIGAFLAVAIEMSGEVLASRAQNVLTYNAQDALNRIKADTKKANAFLAQNDVAVTTSTYQGRNNTGVAGSTDTTGFVNAGTDGDTLILTLWATTGNPANPASELAYKSRAPNPCGSAQTQNTPFSYNVIYFVRDNTLWRRVLMPQGYRTDVNVAACGSTLSAPGIAIPWQRASCAPGYSTAHCGTQDERLVDGVTSANFQVRYFSQPTSSTEVSAARTDASLANRKALLSGIKTAGVTINATQKVAGRDVSVSSTLRATREGGGL